MNESKSNYKNNARRLKKKKIVTEGLKIWLSMARNVYQNIYNKIKLTKIQNKQKLKINEEIFFETKKIIYYYSVDNNKNISNICLFDIKNLKIQHAKNYEEN